MGPNIVSVNSYSSELGKGFLKYLIYIAYYTQLRSTQIKRHHRVVII